MASSARLKANKKYHTKFDDIKIRVPLGERALFKNFAESRGKSLNQYIIDLVYSDMGRLSSGPAPSDAEKTNE